MKLLSTLFLLIVSTVVIAQIHYSQKVFAFVQHNEGGEDRHLIYIQMPADSLPIWDTAILSSKKYTVHFSPVETMPVEVGIRKGDKRKISIKAAPDTKMYMLDFDATGEDAGQVDLAKGNAAVILTGRIKGRKLTYKILTEVEVE